MEANGRIFPVRQTNRKTQYVHKARGGVMDSAFFSGVSKLTALAFSYKQRTTQTPDLTAQYGKKSLKEKKMGVVVT